MVDGETQTRMRRGGVRRDRAPRWLTVSVLTLLALVIVLGVVVRTQLSARRAGEARLADPRVVVLDGLLREDSEDIDTRRQLAQVYVQQNRTGEALKQYKQILSREPDDIASLYNSGLIYLSSGKAKSGETALRRVLELEPTHVHASIALAEHFAVAGRVDEVVGVVKPAADAHDEIADLQYLVGLGYEETGDKAAAVKYYRRALRFVPSMEDARKALDRLGEGQ